ncbi:MAG: hypothetical protein ACRD4S_05450 [Candidatus Acidiferrales bacterium]
MKILVTFALETEFAPWRKLRHFRAAKWGAGRVDAARIDDADVGVLLTGVGPHHAKTRTLDVISGQYSLIDYSISSGLAGALRSEHHLNQVLAARSITCDMIHEDATPGALECDAFLLDLARECGATVVERIHTSDHVISSAKEKQFLGANSDAADMESFAVVQQAGAFAIPSVVIRGISDTSEEDLPLDMNRIVAKDGRISIAKILGQLAWQPLALPKLIRFGEQSKRAAEALVEFLDGYVQALAREEMKRPAKSTVGAR